MTTTKAINTTSARRLRTRLRTWILAEPLRYSQSKWRNRYDNYAPCGTAACLGGSTQVLLHNDGVENAFDLDWYETGKCLGLTARQTDILFAPDPHNRWPARFARRWAATLELFSIPERRKLQARIAADFLNSINKTGKTT